MTGEERRRGLPNSPWREDRIYLSGSRWRTGKNSRPLGEMESNPIPSPGAQKLGPLTPSASRAVRVKRCGPLAPSRRERLRTRSFTAFRARGAGRPPRCKRLQ
ncbi:hypothetical protein SKAU_G00271950 [Synaphobranchus kaupii]|uniref:Uncharacterized protein n=1 Tax=Synaphobranchus kaupii TaxID=118154 RepID=A0A9Q1F0I9_SYNKA|nr:hypothetical protein SKAU_G00271950 [Synaphobranchus kaupii]